MTALALTNLIGIGLVVSHVAVLVVLMVLWAVGGFSFEEFTTAVVLISPLLAAYTTAIIRFFIQNRGTLTSGGDRVNLPYVCIALLLPFLFVALLLAAILMKAWNVGFASFEQFKIAVGVLQSALGVYVAQVLAPLYEMRAARSRSATRS